MKAVEKIDNKINELREVRRMVVKGEKSFNKDDEKGIMEFTTTLAVYDIPFETFTFGSRLFVKVKDIEEVENVEE